VILSVADMGALANVIDERYRALVLISAWCGLRWGEVTESCNATTLPRAPR
jgi:hypothetical protein